MKSYLQKQKETQRHRKQKPTVTRGEGGERINEKFGINRNPVLYTKQKHNKDLLCSTGNDIQHYNNLSWKRL